MDRRKLLATSAVTGSSSLILSGRTLADLQQAGTCSAPYPQKATWRLQYPLTTSEQNAGLSVSNSTYLPGDTRRYG
jgi:hypothetical protein